MKNIDTERTGAQQLTLLTVPTELRPSNAHARFRLSNATRTRGLAHVAEIRAQLAAAKAERDADAVVALPPRHDRAA